MQQQQGVYYDLLIESNNPETDVIRKELLYKLLPQTREVLFLLLEYPADVKFWIESIQLSKKKCCIINKRTFKKFLREVYCGEYLKIYDEIYFLIKSFTTN